LLTDEIHHRKIKRVPFTEPELWYLLYAYLSVKNFLTLNASEYPHNLIGDIRPHNVFINSNGQVKFSSLFSWPSEKTNYSKTFDGTTTYLSPEDCQLLQMGSTNN
jgi:serine/threonine protein kinase